VVRPQPRGLLLGPLRRGEGGHPRRHGLPQLVLELLQLLLRGPVAVRQLGEALVLLEAVRSHGLHRGRGVVQQAPHALGVAEPLVRLGQTRLGRRVGGTERRGLLLHGTRPRRLGVELRRGRRQLPLQPRQLPLVLARLRLHVGHGLARRRGSLRQRLEVGLLPLGSVQLRAQSLYLGGVPRRHGVHLLHGLLGNRARLRPRRCHLGHFPLHGGHLVHVPRRVRRQLLPQLLRL